MDERTVEKIRKFKRDNNMKQSDHGVRVVNFALREEYRSGSEVCAAYATLSVPFYDASITEVVEWAKETFPACREWIGKGGRVMIPGWIVHFVEYGHGSSNKRGDAPVLLRFRINCGHDFEKVEGLSIEGLQELIDAASVLPED